MADEKKLSESSSVSEWIKGYYGFDGLDYPKVEKIRHVDRVAQFSSVCYIVGKNSKKAHTDLFDSNYTASSIKISKSAELIIKLLEMRTKDGGMHRLTPSDFETAGGEELFKNEKKNSPAEYEQIVKDYIGEGGMVDICQTLFPIKKDNALNAKMFKGLTDNMDIIQKDHSQLLTVATDGTKTSLPLKDILSMRYTITECASGKWNEKKSKKSSLQAELMKVKEELYESKRNLAIKGGKLAMLGGVATMSIGAVIGGTFWPALLLIPVYSVGKNWFPDLCKAFGNTWGMLEKQRKVKREIKWLEAQLEYLTQWKVHGTDPRKHKSWMKRSQWRRLRGIDLDNLKKQGKLMQEAVTTEITYYDPVEKKWKEKVQKSAVEETFDAITRGAGVIQDVTKLDDLAPVDLKDYLAKSIENLDPNTATYENFLGVAGDINEFIKKIPSSAQEEIQSAYAEKLEESAKHLVFGTELKTITDYQHRTAKYLADDSMIFKPIKELRPDIVEIVKGYSTLAGKELTGLSSNYIGKSMEDYIMRTPEPNNTSFELSSPELSLVAEDAKFKAPTDKHLITAINAIADLKVSKTDENRFIGNGFSVERLNQEIAQIANLDDKEQCDKLLKDQMRRVAYEKARADSRVTYDALLHGELGGKLDFNELFKKIGEVTYDNIDTFAKFNDDTKKMIPKEVGAYIRGKLAKAIFDELKAYADNHDTEFQADLGALTKHLQKINSCNYLNEYQKSELTTAVRPFIKSALDFECKKPALTFVKDFNVNTFDAYQLKPYQQGGLLEYLNSDQSAETMAVKSQLEYMHKLGNVHKNLKFGGVNMSADDEKIIGQILFLDSKSNFTTSRKDSKELVSFLNKLTPKTNYPAFDGITDPDVLAYKITKDTNLNPYKQLETNLKEVGKITNPFDQYAGLVALKNRGMVDLRDCLIAMTSKLCSDKRAVDSWLAGGEGKKFYEKVLAIWSSGVMKDIDEAIGRLAIEHPEISYAGVSTTSGEDMKRLIEDASYSNIISKELGA